MNSGGPWSAIDESYSNEDQYYDHGMQGQNMDEGEGQHGDMDGEALKKKKPWERVGPDGRAIKKKPNPAKKNAVFRKALQPKSSIMCLNELQSGLKYVAEPVATIGNFSVSVEVNGQTFRGYGTTKDLAKQAAAEAALVSFVKAPPPKPAPGEAPNAEDDTTPWRTLASFAMYKLFSDWRDGRIGMTTPTGQHGFVPSMSQQGMPNNMAMVMQNMQPMQGFQMMQQQGGMPAANTVKDDAAFANVSLHLNRSLSNSTVNQPASSTIPMPGAAKVDNNTPKPPRDVKLNTENQRMRHPVMILHQLCPVIKYESNEIIDPNTNTKTFVVSTLMDNQHFSGEGTTIKAAKFQLAKSALKSLYNIDNEFVLP